MGKVKEMYLEAYEHGLSQGLDHDEADRYAWDYLSFMAGKTDLEDKDHG
jgi:hypothetical protein